MTALTWATCGLILFGLDRLAKKDNSQIWERDRPFNSILAYLVLFIARRFILSGLLLIFLSARLEDLWKGRQPLADTDR